LADSSKTVRIGIIGCGGIAGGKHLPSLAKLGNVEVVAFCDIIESKAQAAAKEYGAPGAKVYADYKKMLTAAVFAIGFSHMTWLPASSASIVMGACESLGVQTWTTSKPPASSIFL